MDLYGFILRATIRFIIINESADFRSALTKRAVREVIFSQVQRRRRADSQSILHRLHNEGSLKRKAKA